LLTLSGAHAILHVSRIRVNISAAEMGWEGVGWINVARDRDR
jgi:hypothetical protein